jgi:hypothetical protein
MATTASAVINTTDTATNTPTVPDASATTKWQEYIWVRHLAGDDAADKAKFYVWNPSITSVTDGLKTLKWQEVTAAVAFSDITGTATIAQLPTGITVSNLSIDGAITNTHLAGGITNANLAGSIAYGKIASVNANTVTSVSGSKIPVDTIPTLANTDIDTILGTSSVDYVKLNIAAGDIPGTRLSSEPGARIVHGQIESVSATTITTGTLPPARLEYMFERNLPIDSIATAAPGTYNLHTKLADESPPAVFEGIIRMQAQLGSGEVIIALPNPTVTAYNGKAAKLSIYKAGSATPGRVTIKVCKSGTDSSALFNAGFVLTETCDTNGNTTINCATANMEVGWTVTGTGIPADTEITVINDANTLTINNAATTDLDDQTLTFTNPLTGLIVDNNNGELTDQVIVMPSISENKARKIVVDLLSDCVSGVGQWIVSGVPSVSGVGVSSQSGISLGQGTDTGATEGVKTTSLEITGKETINTANLDTNNVYNDIAKWAVSAEVDTWQVDTVGTGYTIAKRLKIADTEDDVTTQVEFVTTGVDSDDTTTGWLFMLKLYSAGRGEFSKRSGETYAERIYNLTNVDSPGSPSGGKVQVKLRGIAPTEVIIGEKWYDPWQDSVRIKKS